MKQTIKDLSNALESIRKDQKWIPMLEEQLENAVYFRRINMSDCRDVNADKKENEMKEQIFKLTEALRLSEEENQALKQDVKDSRHEKGIIMNLCMRQKIALRLVGPGQPQ